ncbi:hypothetical protein ACHAWF_004126 [Thalassiosira exigua]
MRNSQVVAAGADVQAMMQSSLPLENAQDSIQKKHQVCLTPWISYDLFQWAWTTGLTVLAVADRFIWNVWPRQMYSIGAGSVGSNRMVGYKPGPWSVLLYDCIAHISGRYSIVTYNYLLITRLECLENLLMQSVTAMGTFVSK